MYADAEVPLVAVFYILFTEPLIDEDTGVSR